MSQNTYIRVCRSCGANFARTKWCPHCGKKVQSGLLLTLLIGMGCLSLVAAFAIPSNKGQQDDMKIIVEATLDQINTTELATIISNKKSHSDPGVQNKFEEITGKIVQWNLEVFVCTKAVDYYQMVTKPTANVPGTLLNVYPRNNQEKQYLENIKPGHLITIKGKISGVQQGRIKINPAIII